MAADVQPSEQEELEEGRQPVEGGEAVAGNGHADGEDGEEEEEEEEEEEDEEETLKYAKLTGSLTNVYRNGDSTSASTVAGDKLVVGTHNGNVHVLSIPSLQPLRTYHAHSATITSISVSPTPPPPLSIHHVESPAAPSVKSPPASIRSQAISTNNTTRTPQSRQPQAIPNTPNNAIYIATSSLDGHVCVTSLLDPKDVQLRNFARPLQAVCLSPDYRNDRTYLSGGLAGQLILTVGGKAGVTVDANTNSAAAAAGGWFGSLGLGGDRGRDTVLHSGEGKIWEIKWSLSSKWVCWVNEEGIKIMRSHLKLGSEQSEDAWRRIAHGAKPNRREWREGASLWRARAQWIDDKKIESNQNVEAETEIVINGTTKKSAKPAKLVVGWGNTAFILLIKEHGTNAAGEKVVGSADIVNKLHFEDCIVSGITLFSPSMLAILAYRTLDDDDKPIQQPQDNAGTRKGRSHRHTSLAPQLRLVEIKTGSEVDVDDLPMSRFETLSAQDYHLSTLFIPAPPPSKTAKDVELQKGALEGLWDAAGGKYATRMFSSGASVLSRSSDGDRNGSFTSPPASAVGVAAAGRSAQKKRRLDAHPYIVEPGLKLFISSPYDCVLAVKRGQADRLQWLMERQKYAQAWELVDKQPDVVPPKVPSEADGSVVGSPRSSKGQGSLADFFTDTATSASENAQHSAAEKEKRRIGELWLQKLVSSNQWQEAGRVAGKVLDASGRWEHWVWTFAQADKFDEITPYIPSMADAQLPGVVYEVILGHYVQADPQRLKDLLEDWDPALDLYDAGSVINAIEARFDRNQEDEVKEGGEEWSLLTECLAQLYLADGRAKEALRCWIRVQNADAAFRLIREEKLMDVVAAEDVPGLLMLRVSKDLMTHGDLSDLEEATSEATTLLVDEALRGAVMPATVISQLEQRGKRFQPFIFFYLRALWNRSSLSSNSNTPSHLAKSRRRRYGTLDVDDGHALVEDHADLAVFLFAQYDRDLLLTFLQSSSLYSYEKAAAICENLHYIPELVHILSKTGQTKRALFLIIDELGDVSQAIAFTKSNPDLWDDLLDYSMDKPAFIKGLLEEVGTAVDPIKLVRRIPESLEIPGLKEGVERLMREYDIQFSISEGVARVLRGEVEVGMETLRAGRGKGVRFEVVHEAEKEVELEVRDPPTKVEGGEELPVPKRKVAKEEAKTVKPGHCAGCGDVFHEAEKEPILGFACGHVYHLSCLLKSNPETSDPDSIERLLSQLRGSFSDDEVYLGSRPTVGAKVSHAHVIRNAVRGGCGVCGVPEGA